MVFTDASAGRHHHALFAVQKLPDEIEVLTDGLIQWCHCVRVYIEQGPSLAAARSRGSEALLLGILDPNREVLPAFVTHTAVTTGGRIVTGLITAESDHSVSLQLADGSQQVLGRDAIESLASTGRSLMPEGFERSIEPAAMADLLAFLMTAK